MDKVESMITEHIDIWTSAIKSKSSVGRGSNVKRELYGIKKLRELILELAIRGLLVPQDERNEPANELVKRIAEERNYLIKEKKLKRQRSLPTISEDEIPYEKPKGWQFVRLNDVIQISSGKGLTASNMNNEGNIPVFGGNGITGYHDVGNVDKQTIVIGRVGFYCGSIHITPKVAWVTDNAFITTFSEKNIDLKFLFWLLKGTNLKENENATAQPVISGRKIYPIIVGLPPKSEQIKIVNCLESLNAFCDQLEQQSNASIETHEKLVSTLLKALTDAVVTNENGAKQFQQAWERIAENFDILFTTENSVEELKQAILQLAVMGKLVPQDPSDEPASLLLEKIAAEKELLIKDKKIKKQKTLPEVSNEEFPCQLPCGWEFIRLNDIIQISSGKGLTSSQMVKDGNIPVYGGNGVTGYHDSYNVKKETLVIGRVGFYCGSIHLTPNYAWVTDNAFITTFSENNMDQKFLFWLLKGTNLKENENATAQPVISGKKIYPIVVGLPPKKEQARIVSMLEAAYSLCESLKEKLNLAHNIHINVTDSIYQQSLR